LPLRDLGDGVGGVKLIYISSEEKGPSLSGLGPFLILIVGLSVDAGWKDLPSLTTGSKKIPASVDGDFLLSEPYEPADSCK
jgi:hypothetical protein